MKILKINSIYKGDPRCINIEVTVEGVVCFWDSFVNDDKGSNLIYYVVGCEDTFGYKSPQQIELCIDIQDIKDNKHGIDLKVGTVLILSHRKLLSRDKKVHDTIDKLWEEGFKNQK